MSALPETVTEPENASALVVEAAPLPPLPVLHWLKGEARQNFGDYLSVFFLRKALLQPLVSAAAYRLVGSVIHDVTIADDLRSVDADTNGKVAYWGCGMRENRQLSAEMREKCSFYGVRGPLTRNLLGLPRDTVLGDTGFLVPLLHRRKRSLRTANRSICVPHFHDTKTEAALLAQSGADVVVRPGIDNRLSALEQIIDEIASANFVLAGSLHAAVIACAYEVPFAFWDNGHMDLPFKWRDLAGSLNITASFVANVEDGRLVYHELFRRRLRRPLLLPLLQVAPFAVRPNVLARAASNDGLTGGTGLPRPYGSST